MGSRDAATGTVPAEYGEFWTEMAAFPSVAVLCGGSAAWVVASSLAFGVALDGTPAVQAAGVAFILASGILLVVSCWLSARSNARRALALRRDPQLFYRTVETSVAAADSSVVPLTYRLYADGSTSVPEASWVVPAAV